MNGATPAGPSVVMPRSTMPSMPPWSTGRRSAKNARPRSSQLSGRYWLTMHEAMASSGQRRDHRRRDAPAGHQPRRACPRRCRACRRGRSSQPRQTSWKVTNRAQAARGPPLGHRRQPRGDSGQPAAAADHLADAVVGSPEDEGPRSAVPQTAEEHGHEDVDGDPPLGPPVAAERYVQIVPQPERQGDVPPAPEVLQVHGRVGAPEVDREAEAHQHGEPDGDVGVAAEVGVDLAGVAPDGEQDLGGRVLPGLANTGSTT